MLNMVCLRNIDLPNCWSLDNYLKLGGYDILSKVLTNKLSPDNLVEEIKTANLRGRGGAGFPTGLKLSFIPNYKAGQKYIVCNADEGEPGTFKDRDILRFNPHQLIEGMIITAYLIGANVGYIYLRGEFYEPIERVENAIVEAKQSGFLGSNLFESGFNFDLHCFYGAGAYICGEETALLESLEGKKGMPRFKPPFPANCGLFGKPTNVNNVETLASIPMILSKGGKWFSDLGTPKSGGCKVFSVSGHVNNPGNFELPLGTPFSKLLELAGGVKDGKKIKAVIPGGSSVPVLPANIAMAMNMDYESIGKAGSMLGSGAVIVMDDSTCMVKVLARISAFYAEESCGQCTPCREGTTWLHKVLHRIIKGQGKIEDLEYLDRVAKNICGRTICALGDAAAMPVRSFLHHFRDEFEYFVINGKSKVEI